MKMNIEEYKIGDIVDVFPLKNDCFDEFTGRITSINIDQDLIIVTDQDDESYGVYAKQIQLTYNEVDDSVLS